MLSKRQGTQTGTSCIYLVITRLFEKIKWTISSGVPYV